jgi:RNA recognition motif-containing protein
MTTIFVGNLSFQATESEIERMFARYGRVSSVSMATDRCTGTPRGFAFVRMPGMDDAEEAIARLNGQSLCGRPLTVNEAHAKTDSGPARPAGGRRSALLDSL